MPENKRLTISYKYSVAAYLRCGADVNSKIKNGLLLSLSVIFFKSVTSYKQDAGCLTTTLPKDEESARDSHLLASKFFKYSPIIFLTNRLAGVGFSGS